MFVKCSVYSKTPFFKFYNFWKEVPLCVCVCIFSVILCPALNVLKWIIHLESIGSRKWGNRKPWLLSGSQMVPPGALWSLRGQAEVSGNWGSHLQLWTSSWTCLIKKCLLYYFIYRSQQKVSWPWKSWACFRFVSLFRSQAVAPKEPGKVTTTR